MSSFLYDFVSLLDAKWDEVDILINEAKTIREANERLYNAICRSLTVLIVAHLEGFAKDLVRNVVKDLNSEVDFMKLPIAIKRTYCKKYLGSNLDKEDKNHNDKLQKLIAKFEEVNCDISDEPFFYPVNRNPNPAVINNVFANFGMEKVFWCLYESDLENVFSESNNEIRQRIIRLRGDIRLSVKQFPYSFDLDKYTLSQKRCSGNQTLWQEFLDEINKKRHNVAHGNNFENVDDILSLEARKDKVVLLELGLTGLLASAVTRTT
jgi:tRNA uridine 5-carbamoylmethylation protein Kti12